MAWINAPGITGKVYVPDDDPREPKKHPCTTCFACQWCDDNRCRICRCDGADADEAPSKHCCANK